MVRKRLFGTWAVCILCLLLIASLPGAAQSNGINVGKPKVYDDRSLELMLQAAEANLAKLKFLDQASIAAKIGGLQGAISQETALAAQVTGRPTPEVTSTAVTGATPSTTTVTKTPSVTPSVPTPSQTGGFALPTGFSSSALDTLAEQMQLTYEIANLRLLLEGSLSDRFVKGTPIPKLRTTIGFPISIEVPKGGKFRNAVAEVEVTVRTASDALSADVEEEEKRLEARDKKKLEAKDKKRLEAPGLVAILPREKTYNAAKITDNLKSIGGAVVAQVVTLGVSWSRRIKTYYLIQDLDTVALERSSPDDGSTTFVWQFRPVLGQPTVRPGLHQTFVQMAFPVEKNKPVVGHATVTTRWRKYDLKTRTVGDVIGGSTGVTSVTDDILGFDLTPMMGTVRWEDAGKGQIAVTIDGAYLPGTSARIGAAVLGESSPEFILNPNGIRFLAPAQLLLAAAHAYLVSRSGEYKEIQVSKCVDVSGAKAKIRTAIAEPYSGTESKVTVNLEDGDFANPELEPPLILVGGQVFGLTETPFKGDPPVSVQVTPSGANTPITATQWRSLVFIAPTELLRRARQLTLKHLFCGPDFQDTHEIEIRNDYTATKVTRVAITEKQTTLAILGSNLEDDVAVLLDGKPAAPVSVASADPASGNAEPNRRDTRNEHNYNSHASKPIALAGKKERENCDEKNSTVDRSLKPTLLLLKVPACRIAGLKQIVLKRTGAQPVLLSLEMPPPKLELEELKPVPRGYKGKIKLTGKNLDLLVDILYEGKTLSPEAAPDRSYFLIAIDEKVTNKVDYYVLTVIAKDGSKLPLILQVKNPEEEGEKKK